MPVVFPRPTFPLPGKRPDQLPENVGRLPTSIPGDLGALSTAGAAIRLPIAGTLPNALPGNFNDIVFGREIPYGSVGFTLICRSASDFTTILAILYDYSTMGFTDELNGAGAGSVTLDPDDPFLTDQLVGAETVEDLFTKDNLWEVYFDGQRRFMWLGQNVTEPKVTAGEDRTVNISGPGIGQTLEWGLVLPNRFPAMKPKLETVVADFTDQDLDIYGLWKSTGGTVQAVEGRVNVRVTTYGGEGSFFATAYGYDFVESGVVARVVPYSVGSTGGGKVRTFVSIETIDGKFARIYTDLNTSSDSYDLVAETSSPPQTTRIPYTSAHAYWRMQELDGKVIFSTRPENSAATAWVTFATVPYTFDATSIRLRMKVDAVTGTGLTIPQTSSFSLVNVDGVAAPVKPMERYRRLIQKCQSRGTLKHILPNWTAQADSMGANWVSDATVDVQVGSDLLAVLNDYCNAIQADWFMDADYRLQIRQRVYSEGGNDPTAPFHKEDQVIFYEAESQETKERRRAYGNVRNYLVGKTDTDEFVVKTDSTSIASFQQRETLISDSLTKDTGSLDTVLENNLASVKDGTISWTLTVPYDTEGKRLYEDYSLGDWISVQTAFPFRRDAWRIAAISIQVGASGDPTVELTLNDKMTPYWIKVRDEIKRQRWPKPPSRGLQGISKNPGWYAA